MDINKITDEQIDILLNELDTYCRVKDEYDWGLPLYETEDNKGPLIDLRDKVKQWLISTQTETNINNGNNDQPTI